MVKAHHPPAPPEEAGKKKNQQQRRRHLHRGTRSFRDIMRYQKTTEHLMHRLPFERLVREIATDHWHSIMGSRSSVQPVRWSSDAINVIQDVVEALVTQRFYLGSLLAIHRQRVTVTPGDLKMVNMILTFSGEAGPQTHGEITH